MGRLGSLPQACSSGSGGCTDRSRSHATSCGGVRNDRQAGETTTQAGSRETSGAGFAILQRTAPPPTNRAMINLPVYVLVGGRSIRFGVDKATYPIEGLPWAVDTGKRLAGKRAQVTFVGNDLHSSLKAHGHLLPDASAVEGPLAGTIAALEHRLVTSGPGRLVLASCDLVRPEPEWLKPLIDAHSEHQLDFAAYRSSDRWQPFPSIVHTRWLEPLSRLSAGGVRSFQQALNQAQTAAVDWPHEGNGPPQANTVEELEKLLGEN